MKPKIGISRQLRRQANENPNKFRTWNAPTKKIQTKRKLKQKRKTHQNTCPERYSSDQKLGSWVQLWCSSKPTKIIISFHLGLSEMPHFFCRLHPKINIYCDIDWSGKASKLSTGYQLHPNGILKISIQILLLFFFFFKKEWNGGWWVMMRLSIWHSLAVRLNLILTIFAENFCLFFLVA